MIHSNGIIVDHIVRLDLKIRRGAYNARLEDTAVIEALAIALLKELGYEALAVSVEKV